MNALKVSLLAAAASLAVAGTAAAQDNPISLSFNVGAATDYVYRGVSQTDEQGQIFAGMDATLGEMGYAGIWVSNVEFGNGTKAEYDLYAGVKPTLGPATLDVGVIYYGYTNQPTALPDQDFWEGKIAASMPAGPATVGAALFYSPEFFGETGEATYVEVNGAMPIPNSKFTVSGALGHQSVVGPADYTTWNLGVGYALNDILGLDLRYWDTSEHDFGVIYDSRVVLAIKASF